jgi:hypothetical protein
MFKLDNSLRKRIRKQLPKPMMRILLNQRFKNQNQLLKLLQNQLLKLLPQNQLLEHLSPTPLKLNGPMLEQNKRPKP